MPKIQRKTQKIFCNSADSDQLAVFGSMATGSPVYSNDVEQLQSNEAYNIGWDAATLEDKAPFMEEMNGVQYGLSYQTAYLLQQGIPEWDEGTEYFANTSFCQVNGVIYLSTTDNNIGNNPVNDTTNWTEFGFSAYVKKSGDTMTGSLDFSGASASIGLFGGAIYTHSTTYAFGDTPSSAKYEIIIQHEDKNKVRKSRLESAWLTDGSHLSALSEKKSASENSYASVQVGWDKDGKAFATAPTPATGDNSTKIATTAFVNTVLPAGTIVSSGRSSTPTGYLYCNGSAVSRTTYANLFNAIGTTYGTGDGSTTFNLPNFTNYKFVTSTTVGIKGTGKALGMTDGTTNFGTRAYTGVTAIYGYKSSYNANLGGISSSSGGVIDGATIGVVQNTSTSGLTGTASTATLKWYIKY